MLMKKHLTRQEEFDILKIVVDKFLLLAVFFVGYGIFKIVDSAEFTVGFCVLLAGVILLIIMSVIFVREYEFIKS